VVIEIAIMRRPSGSGCICKNIPLTFSHGAVMGPHHFWSLAVEEQFYLAWPLIVLASKRRTLLRIIGVAIVISFLARIALARYNVFYFTLAHLDGLAIGAGVAILWRRPRTVPSMVGFARYTLFIICPLTVSAQLVMSGRHNFILQIVKSTLVSLVYASLLVLVATKSAGQPVERILTSPVMRSTGRYSYGMYVMHPFLLGWFKSLRLPYSLFGLATVVAMTYLAAMICWHAFEKRFLQLKRHFDYGQAPLPPANPPIPAMALASSQV
jgi:peptidoglycan/LPS O-acetylase OafA/YrhL